MLISTPTQAQTAAIRRLLEPEVSPLGALRVEVLVDLLTLITLLLVVEVLEVQVAVLPDTQMAESRQAVLQLR
jgi:hypothetical protein